MNNIGKIIWTRGHKEKGVVRKESERYCACCGHGTCLIVDWEDGKMTKDLALITSLKDVKVLNSEDFIKEIRNTFDAM